MRSFWQVGISSCHLFHMQISNERNIQRMVSVHGSANVIASTWYKSTIAFYMFRRWGRALGALLWQWNFANLQSYKICSYLLQYHGHISPDMLFDWNARVRRKFSVCELIGNISKLRMQTNRDNCRYNSDISQSPILQSNVGVSNYRSLTISFV